MPSFHFIAGLPRSGSTLLSAILLQNPVFHADISSPLYDLVTNKERLIRKTNEQSVRMAPDARKRLLAADFEGLYSDAMNTKQFIFDTNRLWPEKMSLLAEMHPKFQMICCVRPIGWVLNSFERIYQSNPLSVSRIFNPPSWEIQESRMAKLIDKEGVIGLPLGSLEGAWVHPEAHRLLVIIYDKFVANPEKTLRNLYTALELPYFAHDFENVSFSSPEMDAYLDAPGLHTVKGPVREQKHKAILPEYYFRGRYEAANFWVHRTPPHLIDAAGPPTPLEKRKKGEPLFLI